MPEESSTNLVDAKFSGDGEHYGSAPVFKGAGRGGELQLGIEGVQAEGVGDGGQRDDGCVCPSPRDTGDALRTGSASEGYATTRGEAHSWQCRVRMSGVWSREQAVHRTLWVFMAFA